MSLISDPNGAVTHPKGGAMARAEHLAPEMKAWRRAFHRRPERSFHEFETAARVASILEAIPGMTVIREFAGTTAVVGRLGTPGPHHVALRADMDALPIEEPASDADFFSDTPGLMHACGHDGHMAILLGAAHLIAESLAHGEMAGQVTFIFQPAEETADANGNTGAPYLLDAGVLDGVDALMALHMDPQSPVGTVRLHDGACMANVDNFRARVIGHGGHAGYPNLALDPLWLLIPVLEAVHGIRARRLSPLDSAAVSVCHIEGGTTNNVIPPYVDLAGTLRSYRDDVREALTEELRRALSVSEALGGHYELSVERCEPAVLNSFGINRVLAGVMQEALHLMPSWTGPFGMGGEDFGFMSRKVPASLFFLGCADPAGTLTSLHSPDFFLDERALPIGSAIFLEAVKAILNDGL